MPKFTYTHLLSCSCNKDKLLLFFQVHGKISPSELEDSDPGINTSSGSDTSITATPGGRSLNSISDISFSPTTPVNKGQTQLNLPTIQTHQIQHHSNNLLTAANPFGFPPTAPTSLHHQSAAPLPLQTNLSEWYVCHPTSAMPTPPNSDGQSPKLLAQPAF